jgi:hypothetical protein
MPNLITGDSSMTVSFQPPPRRIAPGMPAAPHAPGPLRARVYDLVEDGQYLRCSEPKTVEASTRLHVTASSVPDGLALPLRTKDGMAVEPILFECDPHSGYWLVRNNGHTNALRVQPWGLRPFPLQPQTTVAMPSTDVAVWIPVLPQGADPGDRGETFRVVIAHTPELPATAGKTRNIIAPKRKGFTDEQMESLLYFFGEMFSWPPHPAPHVRSTAELRRTVVDADSRFIDAKGRLIDPHAMFRTSKSGQRDWYPPSGRPGSVETYISAVERLVELGSLTLGLVWYSSVRLNARNYVPIDETLVHDRRFESRLDAKQTPIPVK